jgi:hypothetical protein
MARDDLEVVTRQDAARRQITTAIELILGGGDAVSANVLTWAATEMLRGVAEHRGVETFHATLESRIKPEFLRQWRDILKSHYNYAKHADRDPERVVEDFSPEATTWALFGAGIDYATLYGKRTWPMLVYHIWFLCRHPEITVDEGRTLAEKMAPGLEYPKDRPLRAAVAAAMEMITTGRKHPEVLDALGPGWLATIEPE